MASGKLEGRFSKFYFLTSYATYRTAAAAGEDGSTTIDGIDIARDNDGSAIGGRIHLVLTPAAAFNGIKLLVYRTLPEESGALGSTRVLVRVFETSEFDGLTDAVEVQIDNLRPGTYYIYNAGDVVVDMAESHGNY